MVHFGHFNFYEKYFNLLAITLEPLMRTVYHIESDVRLIPGYGIVVVIIIIMVIFKHYFSREHIALSTTKNGVSIELGKNNRLRALRMMQNLLEISKLCVNKPRQSIETKSICKYQYKKKHYTNKQR